MCASGNGSASVGAGVVPDPTRLDATMPDMDGMQQTLKALCGDSPSERRSHRFLTAKAQAQ